MILYLSPKMTRALMEYRRRPQISFGKGSNKLALKGLVADVRLKCFTTKATKQASESGTK
jgi:hypothetical protein